MLFYVLGIMSGIYGCNDIGTIQCWILFYSLLRAASILKLPLIISSPLITPHHSAPNVSQYLLFLGPVFILSILSIGGWDKSNGNFLFLIFVANLKGMKTDIRDITDFLKLVNLW